MSARHYQRCPTCARVTPWLEDGDTHCPHDGSRLLRACAHCAAPITSPVVGVCPVCGARYGAPGKRPTLERVLV